MHWIFDLDGTLYDAVALFAKMNQMSTSYLSELLHIGEEDAHKLLRHYLDTYGSLANGLSYHYDVEFDTFFARQYQLEVLLPLVPIHPDVHRLREFEGKKFILSNAPALWVNAVLDHLGIADVFDGVYCCDSFDHLIKPNPYPYLELCRQHDIAPEHCVFFDDTISNVAAANQVGMLGVHVAVGDGHWAPLPDGMAAVRGIPNPDTQDILSL